MYLFILDYELGDIHVIRDVPDDIEDLDLFVYQDLGYDQQAIEYMTAEEDGVIYYNTWNNKTKKVVEDGVDYIGQKF